MKTLFIYTHNSKLAQLLYDAFVFKAYIQKLITRGVSALRCFLSTVGEKELLKRMAENIKKKICSNFEPTIFDRVVKIAFYVSGGTFCYKKISSRKNISFLNFSDIERTFFGICTKNFRHGCQNCILLAQRNVLGKI